MYADITLKARCADPIQTELILLKHQADYIGLDLQTDTFYEADTGKLKHREGNIENVLIHYIRKIREGVKQTEVLLYLKNPGAATIAQVCGDKKVLGKVKKLRKIFYIGNVKFHLDQLPERGHFIEIEAIDLDGSVGIEVLQQQCNYYRDLLQIADEDLVNDSYIDL